MQAELDPREVLTVLDRKSFYAALKLIDLHPGSRLQRHAAAAFAEEVLPFFEREFRGDPRPRRAIEAARDDRMSPRERARAALAAEDAYEAAALRARTAVTHKEDSVQAERAAAQSAAEAAKAAVRAALPVNIEAVIESIRRSASSQTWATAESYQTAMRAVDNHIAAITEDQNTILRKMLTEGF